MKKRTALAATGLIAVTSAFVVTPTFAAPDTEAGQVEPAAGDNQSSNKRVVSSRSFTRSTNVPDSEGGNSSHYVPVDFQHSEGSNFMQEIVVSQDAQLGYASYTIDFELFDAVTGESLGFKGNANTQKYSEIEDFGAIISLAGAGEEKDGKREVKLQVAYMFNFSSLIEGDVEHSTLKLQGRSVVPVGTLTNDLTGEKFHFGSSNPEEVNKDEILHFYGADYDLNTNKITEDGGFVEVKEKMYNVDPHYTNNRYSTSLFLMKDGEYVRNEYGSTISIVVNDSVEDTNVSHKLMPDGRTYFERTITYEISKTHLDELKSALGEDSLSGYQLVVVNNNDFYYKDQNGDRGDFHIHSVPGDPLDLTGPSVLNVVDEISPSPVAKDDTVTVEYGESATVDVLDNDEKGSGDFTKVELEGADESGKIVTDQGTWEVKDNKVVFTPKEGFSGEVAPVKYVATDANGKTGTAQIIVTVNEKPTDPEPEQPTDPAPENPAVPEPEQPENPAPENPEPESNPEPEQPENPAPENPEPEPQPEPEQPGEENENTAVDGEEEATKPEDNNDPGSISETIDENTDEGDSNSSDGDGESTGSENETPDLDLNNANVLPEPSSDGEEGGDPVDNLVDEENKPKPTNSTTDSYAPVSSDGGATSSNHVSEVEGVRVATGGEIVESNSSGLLGAILAALGLGGLVASRKVKRVELKK